MNALQHYLADEAAMLALGAELARACTTLAVGDETSLVVYLQGNLGMGKTTLTRGLLRGLDYQGAVKSPTYTLVEPYRLAQADVFHFDLYRLGDPEELEYMGIRDYFSPLQSDRLSLCLVEWPDCGSGYLPAADMVVSIYPEGAGRRVQLSATSPRGITLLKAVDG